MFIFEFAKKHYIGLDVACSSFLNMPLASVLTDLSPALCFYYRDMVIYQKESVFFEGLVFPDLAVLTTTHINASIEYADRYTPKHVQLSSHDFLNVLSKLNKKPNYGTSFTNAGTATTHNAILGNQTISPTDSFFDQRQQPVLNFELLEHVLPYYLIPIDWLQAFASHKGIKTDVPYIENAQIIPLMELKTKKGSRLSNSHTRTTGDSYQALFKHYTAQILTLEQGNKTLQDNLSGKETQLQAALTTIQNLQEQLASRPTDSDSPSRSALRLAGALAIDAHYIDIHGERLTGIGDMKKYLDILGVRIDEDSIRTVLKLASEKIDKIDIRPDHPAYKK